MANRKNTDPTVTTETAPVETTAPEVTAPVAEAPTRVVTLNLTTVNCGSAEKEVFTFQNGSAYPKILGIGAPKKSEAYMSVGGQMWTHHISGQDENIAAVLETAGVPRFSASGLTNNSWKALAKFKFSQAFNEGLFDRFAVSKVTGETVSYQIRYTGPAIEAPVTLIEKTVTTPRASKAPTEEFDAIE